jgi:hypothetical protein
MLYYHYESVSKNFPEEKVIDYLLRNYIGVDRV